MRTFLRGLAAVMGLVSLSWVAAVTYTLKGRRKEKVSENCVRKVMFIIYGLLQIIDLKY